MATLHGNWIPDLQQFFLWGETWQKATPVTINALTGDAETMPVPGKNPYQLDQKALANSFKKSEELDLSWMQEQVSTRKKTSAKAKAGEKAAKKRSSGKSTQRSKHWLARVVVLPTKFTDAGVLPTLSAKLKTQSPDNEQEEALASSSLYPWQVSGSVLNAQTTAKFLSAVPLGHSEASAFVGSDLRYWSHLTRWCLDLLARGKFVPVVSGDKKGAIASWQLLIDSAVDQARLKDFCDRLPLICRSYAAPTNKKTSALKVDLPLPNEALVRSFLETLVDSQVRSIAQANQISPSAPLNKEIPLREWLNALGEPDPHFESAPAGVVRLNDAINTWTSPLQNLTDTVEGFRTCFTLQPPATGSQDWTLRYGLQAIDDDDYKIDAGLIWQNPTDELIYEGRSIEAPQETLLAGLGRAIRLYEPIKQTLIEESPTECVLGPIEAFQFIKMSAWRLQDSGFGVILPDNLVDPNKVGASRLGLQVSATAPPKNQRLGLQSLLNFKWDLSVGGQIISKAEFDELVTQGTPLV
ncbi:MAG: SNF2 helicase-associated domain-containing protein, partial [Cyanobacteria bacterium P01_F01_bin.3]